MEPENSDTAAIRAELIAGIARWRESIPDEHQPGNTLFLGIADRAIALTTALIRDVTQVVFADQPLRDRATLGERIELIKRIDSRRRTECSLPPRSFVSAPDKRTLERFVALRNAVAHQEGERMDAAALGRYRPAQVAAILDLAEAIASMAIVDETICVLGKRR
jgi:hypothetical protein